MSFGTVQNEAEEAENVETNHIIRSPQDVSHQDVVQQQQVYTPPRPQAQGQAKKASLILEGIDGEPYHVYQTPKAESSMLMPLGVKAQVQPNFDADLDYDLDELGPVPDGAAAS